MSIESIAIIYCKMFKKISQIIFYLIILNTCSTWFPSLSGLQLKAISGCYEYTIYINKLIQIINDIK